MLLAKILQCRSISTALSDVVFYIKSELFAVVFFSRSLALAVVSALAQVQKPLGDSTCILF